MVAEPSSAVEHASESDAARQSLAPTSVAESNGAVTEDEAALYDRQIRLWGLAAQTKLRSAHILIVGWNGIATEVIKNTVLSGIGSITVLDPSRVDGAVDLLSGFFFRDEDVGQLKCSQAPLDRVRNLNPLVKVRAITDEATYQTLLEAGENAQAWLKEQGVDVMVVGTPLPESKLVGVGEKEALIALNHLARAGEVKFFLSATYGFGGFYFADQLTHDYLVERNVLPTSSGSTSSDAPQQTKRVKQRQTFVPLSASLSHTWTNLTDRQARRNPVPLDWFIWLSLTDLQSRLAHDAATTTISPSVLKERTMAMIQEKGWKPETILPKSAEHVDRVFDNIVAPGGVGVTFAPVAAMLGGVLGQDILNSIGGREDPVVNWLFLSSDASGTAVVQRIGDLPSAVVVD